MNKKIEVIRKIMETEQVDCLLFSPSAIFDWISGQHLLQDERISLWGICAEGRPFLLVDEIYRSEAGSFADTDVYLYGRTVSPMSLLKKKVRHIHKALINNSMRADCLLLLMNTFPECLFLSADEKLASIRMIKTEEELNSIRYACLQAENSIERIYSLGRYWIGKTEKQVMHALNEEMESRGLSDCFSGVSTGKNTSNPHHLPDSSVICDESPLLIDFIATYHGYYSDMTRMCFFGNPSKEFIHIYRTVNEAFETALGYVNTGIPLGKIDKTARDVIQSAGYGKFFIHRTGHGIGRECHEPPFVEENNSAIISDGMVFSIEPGIYLPQQFGVRIENLICVNNGKGKSIHSMSRNLVIIQ